MQQLHNNPASIQPQHQPHAKSTNLIITPPSTVSSVSSSSSIASNQTNNNNKSSLSINPSSTSSNASSTQMISPVSIASTGADNPAPNSNIRSSSVDTSHHYNAAAAAAATTTTSYYNSASANTMQYYASGSNPAQSSYPVYANQPSVSYGSSSNLNLSMQQPAAGLNRSSNNSSPQLIYSATASSATARSHSVAPAPASASSLNTSQSPHNNNNAAANKLSTTPTPTTPNPTPASSSSYATPAGYNPSQIASSSSAAPALTSSKTKSTTASVKSQQFQSIESLSSYNQTPNVTFGQRFDPMAALSALSTPGFCPSSDVAGFGNGLANAPSQFSSTQYSSAQYYNQALASSSHSSYLPPLPSVVGMNHPYKVNFHSDLMLPGGSGDAKKSSKEPAALPTTPKKSSKSTKKSKSSAQSATAQPAAPTLHNQLGGAHGNPANSANWYTKSEPLGWNSKVGLPGSALPLPIGQPSRQYGQSVAQTQPQANHYAAQYGQPLKNDFFPKPNELSSVPGIQQQQQQQQQHQSRLYQHQYEANSGGLLSNSSNYIKVNSSQPAQAQQAHRAAAASSAASGAPTISYTHGASQISSQQQQQRVLNTANPQDSLFMRNAAHSNLYQQQQKQQLQQQHQNYQNQIGQHQQAAQSAHPGNQQHQQYQTANSFSTYPNQFGHVNPNTAYLNSANYQTFAHQLNQPTIGAAAAAVAAFTQNGLLGNQFPTHLNWTSNLN